MSKSIVDKWTEQSSQHNRPLQASLELTYRCNQRCLHCYLDNYQEDQSKLLNSDQWINILEQLRSAGTLYLTLTGGEAMLSPHFWVITENAGEMGFYQTLITNGQMIDSKEIAKKLKEVGIAHITFSLYSLDPNIHDQLVQLKGAHQKIIKAIDWAQNVGIACGVNCLLTNKNIEGYFHLAQWCLDRNIAIREDPGITCKLSGDLAPAELRPSDQQLLWFFKKRTEIWPKAKIQEQKILAEDCVCNIAKGRCAINPYGDLLGCVEVRESFGNLLQEPFEKLWNGVVAQKWRQMKNADIKGLMESTFRGFYEHCPGMSNNEIGDPFEMTPDSLRLAKIKKESTKKTIRPFTINFQGKSMLPTFIDKDILFVSPMERESLQIGDIILVKSDQELVAHRIVKYRGEWRLKGDRSLHIDQFFLENYIGLVTGYHRQRKDHLWGIQGNPTKKIIAYFSAHTTAESFKLVRWIFLLLIIMTSFISKICFKRS